MKPLPTTVGDPSLKAKIREEDQATRRKSEATILLRGWSKGVARTEFR
jgi:hypothetical protein